jgi:hypothetical protein
MNRGLRVLLAVAIIIACTAINLKLFGKIPSSTTLFFLDSTYFLPVCILLLPMALYFDRLDIRRSVLLVCGGAIIGPAVMAFEIVFHLVHAKHLPYPGPSWFARELSYLAVGTALACSVYVLICGSVEHRLLASNHRHDR